MSRSYWWFIGGFILISTLLFSWKRNEKQIPLDVIDLEKLDTVSLTKHWESPIPNLELPAGITSLSAAECGKCHQEIYEEWQMSTHAHAWTDLQYQAELEKNQRLFICINCHLPLQNQQEYIVTGIINGDHFRPVRGLNLLFDEELQQEGITCLGCHIKDGNIIGVNSDIAPPHSYVVDKEYLSETLCLSCHNAEEQVSDELICTFETGSEWEAGPFSKVGVNCIGCHMPAVERQVIQGQEMKQGFRHYFPGSGIPKEKGQKVKGLNGYTIQPESLKENYKVGDMVHLSLNVKNDFAGHKVPTGDPERFFLINFFVKDKNGTSLYEKEFRIGEQWEWHPVARKIKDNNLLPGENREFSTDFEITSKTDLVWQVVVSKHRISKESMEYHHLTDIYPDSIIIFDEEYPIGVK